MEYVENIIFKYEDYYGEMLVDLEFLETGTVNNKRFQKKVEILKANIDKLMDKNEKFFSIVDALAILIGIMSDWESKSTDQLHAIYKNVKRLTELISNPTTNRIIDDEHIQRLQSSFELVEKYFQHAKRTASYSPKACSSDVRDEYIAKLKSTLNLIEDYHKNILAITP